MRTFILLSAFFLLHGTMKGQQALIIPDTLTGTDIQLNLQQGSKQFLTGQPTATMGVNGNFLAPTLILQKGQQVNMRVTNQLTDTTTIHWHGMHVAPENDGGPHIFIEPGKTWMPSFTVMDRASTHWYHPHLHHKTYDHVQLGIAGFIIVRDSIEAALDLPRTYGVDDIPLVIQSRAFDSNNQIITSHTASDSVLMVNGVMKPFIQMPAQMVRLRLLNGSPERVYNFGLNNNQSFFMIGSDGGLLSSPVSLTRIMLAPGERAEILVNLNSRKGDSLKLMNYGSELTRAIYGAAQPGMGQGLSIPGYSANPLNGKNYEVLTMYVGDTTARPVTTVPASLATHQPWTAAQSQKTREFVFMPSVMGPDALNNPFMINNSHFDMDVINEVVPFDNIEIWTLRNQSPIAHPFHIHNVPFYILDINGAAPPAHQAGLKDVVLVPAGNSVVRFITRFTDFHNDSIPYMYHCHMLSHEDDGMMGQFLVKLLCPDAVIGPMNQTVVRGADAIFRVSLPDSSQPAYQWQERINNAYQDIADDVRTSGTRTGELTIKTVTASDNNRNFRCLVTLPCKSFVSDSAFLYVGNDSSVNQEELFIYPNPATDWIMLSDHWITRQAYEASLYDAKGSQLMHWRKNPGDRQLSLKHLPAASYWLRIRSGGFQTSIKLIKTNR